VTVLASNAATQGYEITRAQGEVGVGPPPHSHNWDESFYVLAGEVEFTCGPLMHGTDESHFSS